jgi:hypothetical protein
MTPALNLGSQRQGDRDHNTEELLPRAGKFEKIEFGDT